MLTVTFSGQVAAEAHGDRASGDFGKACGDYQMRLRHSSRDTGRQSERHGEAVDHTDHNVFDGISPLKMFFVMIGQRHTI